MRPFHRIFPRPDLPVCRRISLALPATLFVGGWPYGQGGEEPFLTDGNALPRFNLGRAAFLRVRVGPKSSHDSLRPQPGRPFLRALKSGG